MEELSPTGRVILGMLNSESRSGYDIKQLVDVSTRFFWAASYGQIYPELRRLERAGLIRGSSEPQGGRKRTVYTLTKSGQTALHDWLTSDEQLTYELRDEGALKFFFADALSPAERVRLLRSIRERHEQVLERLRQIRPVTRGKREGFPEMTVEWGIAFHEWYVDWCERTERRLTRSSARKRAGG